MHWQSSYESMKLVLAHKVHTVHRNPVRGKGMLNRGAG